MNEFIDFATEHYILTTAWLVAFFLLVNSLIKGGLSSAKMLKPQEATIAVNRGGVFVDVRSADEFSQGHIQGARNISLEQLKAGETKNLEKFKDAPIVVVCNHGNTAKQGAVALEKAGFSQASVLQGGMFAWKNASFPVSKSKTSGKKSK
ncbi:rhodanese-like domain-containing protein [Aliidiomarina sedimenti]|uniref:Rhodanese-like domain-containing protein n=2 Tax=Aliidiomarina TaxID=1249554 RepID=A0A432WJ88_9GAMM|nr:MULTISPECIES: rhodanese-like domain-containing protein [Aliidiomarina]RUO30734.1 rhodanese-like domain-containing protein [Aliidiomarina sedimenti]RUO33896.1 rhodanese-like domain-containing protein [Aliidiomarina soli]